MEVRVQPTPETLVLEISDTGIGLTDEDAEQLFHRFYRTTRAAVSHIPGLGLFSARAISTPEAGAVA